MDKAIEIYATQSVASEERFDIVSTTGKITFEDELVSMMVEYLCTMHGESELRELVEQAIRHFNGN